MASSALFLNFYTTTLSASLSSTAITMSVSSTTGLPSSLASGQFIPMILTSAAAPGTVYEIVYVTGISGSSLTITRGQEGTSALNWNASDIVYSSNTAQTTGAQEGGTFSNPTLTGTITNSGTISGGNIEDVTIPSGQTLTNDGTISGGTLNPSVINVNPATTDSEPTSLGQMLQTLPSGSSNTVSGTSVSTSVTITAPCTGMVIGIATGTGSTVDGYGTSFTFSGSGSGSTLYAGSNTYGLFAGACVVSGLQSGQSTTITATGTTSSSGTNNLYLLAFFLPTP